VLLIGDLFLPWQSVSLGTFSYSWNAWHGDKGFLLGALTATVVVWVAVAALGLAIPIPARVSETTVTLALAVLVIAVAAVKNIRDMDSAWGSYVGVVLAAALVAAAWQAYRRPRVAELVDADAAPVSTDAV
jgi:F0F1-type ATP synthase membrane subunit a